MFHVWDIVFHRKVPGKYRYLSGDEIKHNLSEFIESDLRKRNIRHLQITMQDTKENSEFYRTASDIRTTDYHTNIYWYPIFSPLSIKTCNTKY